MKEIRRIRYVSASPLEIKTMLEALAAFADEKRRQNLEFEEIVKTANMIRSAQERDGNDRERDGNAQERERSVLLKLREKESHEVLCKALDESNMAKKKKGTSDRTFAVFTKVYNAPTSMPKEMKQSPEYER